MNSELAYNFLYDINKFQEQFQRVLNRTPRERNTSKLDFWIHFFSSISVTIQNTKLNSDSTHVKDISFSIENNSSKIKTKILKLAFKVNNNGQDKVILRSISIGKDNKIPPNNKYSDNELKKIERLFWGDNARKIEGTTIHLANVDVQELYLNIKTSQFVNIKLRDKDDSRRSDSTFFQVKPLQFQRDKTLDTTLDLIAIPEPTAQHSAITLQNNVKTFFNQLIELYNTNKQQVLLKSEVAYHGFIYGVLALNYKNKYAVDIYVEQSAGRGFLDLYFLLRKDADGNNILNAVKIIIEFKGEASTSMSVTNGIAQAKSNSYAAILGRNGESKYTIIVSTDFGNIEKLQVTRQMNIHNVLPQDLISMLINERQVTLSESKIKQAVKDIFDSTRKDESLDRVILGELLSSNVEKNIFVINISDNQHISIFVFKNKNQNAVILTIIERENLNPLTYDRTFLKDPSKRVIKGSTVDKITIEEVTRDAILHIQGELNIIAGKRIDITINPKGKVFESIGSKDFYCLDIKVNDLASNAPQTQQSYISQFTRKYDINSNIDIDHLIPSLQHLDLDNISSPPHDDDRDIAKEQEALNGLREELFKLKDFITLKRDKSAYKTTEANFKSVLHGIFLHKKYYEKSILVVPELSVGHGRADLVLVLASKLVLALELGLGDERKMFQLNSNN